MSSTQSKTLTINSGNATTYLTSSGIPKIGGTTLGYAQIAYIGTASSSKSGYAVLTDSAKDQLYPNSTSKPTSCDYRYDHWSYLATNTETHLEFDGVTIASHSKSDNSEDYTVSGNSASTAVINSTRNSTIRFYIKKNSAFAGYVSLGPERTASITLYFTRYDFSATAGSNVTAASVSSSTGYDGDTIQYRCTLASGAEWQGWYRNGSLYSSTKDLNVTVSGTDLALEARATSSVVTKTLSATYNNAQISGFPKSTQSAVALTYGGTSKGSIPISGGTKTFECGGKLTASAIGIGGTTLNNSGKMMATDVVVTVS